MVAGNNDGVVIARSPAAKALGIAMDAPLHSVRTLLEQHRVVVCSANFALDADLSCRVMDTLGQFTERLEVSAVDEAFLDIAAVAPLSRLNYAAEIRATVGQWIGIPASLSVACTKTLAKVAADRAKRLPGGVLVLGSDGERDALLRSLPVDAIWGVGTRRAAFLRRQEIETAYDFMHADASWIRRHMSVAGARIQLELRGVACLPANAMHEAKKQICTSRSFGRPVIRLHELREAVAWYASRCAAKARAQQTVATCLTVFLGNNRFQAGRGKNCTIQLPHATAETLGIVGMAHEALARIYRRGESYHRAGVILGGFVSHEIQQAEPFAGPDDPTRKQLMCTMDTINGRFGADTIRLLATGIERSWRAKSADRSPGYTTRWSELARAH
ncbi:MAG TPA: Y-family DNA polymerase [Ktedonobacterales bacterium]|nr:Y-family DNA polymerase [Ktedonobacterales bacterium]